MLVVKRPGRNAVNRTVAQLKIDHFKRLLDRETDDKKR
jgi:hypothetical protein